ncbi:AraC family transcriptional regulator [Noviherbaspirillum sedimenti]|uniref:AraC family transcriptional regulator n=1 Tax=Noviherbaspirillum sedimenti TaxID=2320865 RepID=A0A3A3G3C6_9BURK|nr:AraC family transcriptional regulator [Noviherbaspirillum sedimenti]RJG03003.1 AraC family transcriptional regulator [Noviherbaspirillum sedimenti]
MPMLIRSASLNNYVDVARALGIDPFAQLKAARIAATCLNNPDIKISLAAVGRLLESSAHAAGVEDFGLRMAENRYLSNLGPIALAAREEPTIRKALEAMQRYLPLHNDGMSMLIEDIGGLAVLRAEYMAAGGAPLRQAIELANGVLFRYLRGFLGNAWAPRMVCFRHAAPKDMTTHRRLFGRRLEFSREFDGIVCNAADLEASMPNSDPVAARYVHQYLQTLNAQQSATVQGKVRELIWVLLPSGRCSVEQVAKHLGVDRRTIHRHLVQQGETFSTQLEQVRRELAARYIADRNRPLSEVAGLLGFSAPSAFSRWFAQHFGCSATAWRASGHKNVPDAL